MFSLPMIHFKLVTFPCLFSVVFVSLCSFVFLFFLFLFFFFLFFFFALTGHLSLTPAWSLKNVVVCLFVVVIVFSLPKPTAAHIPKQLYKSQPVTSSFPLILFQDQEGNTPLHCAIAGEEHNMVDMLVNNTKLMAAITNHKGFNYLQFAVLKGNKP